MAEERRIGEGNVVAQFQRIRFRNVFAVTLRPCWATLVALPNQSKCRFGGNQAPYPHWALSSAARAFIPSKGLVLFLSFDSTLCALTLCKPRKLHGGPLASVAHYMTHDSSHVPISNKFR
jgi:hypothetical protein